MAAGDVLKGLGVATLKGQPFEIFWTTTDLDPFDPQGDKSASLQTALEAAINAIATPNGQKTSDKTFPVPITIADITEGAGKVHVAHYKPDEMDFVASEAKVPAMYAAFQLRHMVKRFATELGITKKKDLFKQLHKLDTFILANDKVPMLKAAKDIEGNPVKITNEMRLPQYEQMFNVTDGSPMTIEFAGKLEAAVKGKGRLSSPFGQSMFEMIVTSDDPLAARTIDQIGFSFLNGALVAGGYFVVDTDPKKSKGLWLSGDYVGRALRAVWTVNDDAGKIAGTTRRFAQMMAAIQLNFLMAVDPLGDMNTLLNKAVTGSKVWEDVGGSVGITASHYVGNKIGFAELGRRENTQPLTYSEVSSLKSASGKRYVVAWQNLQTKKPKIVAGKPKWDEWQLYSAGDIAGIIRATVKKYEGLAAADDPFPPP